MSDTEIETASTSASVLEELQQQVAQLRTLLAGTLVIVIVLSAGLNLFLWRQLVYTNKDLAAVSPQANQMIADYNRDVPRMSEFLKKLVDYNKTHPDFNYLVARYNLQPVATPAVAPTSPTPAAAPKTPPSPPKK